MHKQLIQITTWGIRKVILLIVLFSSFILLGFSMYHFAIRNHWLELEFEKYPAGLNQVGETYNVWAYSLSGVATLLIVSVFFLLLREIHMRKKLVEELKMQKEHYHVTINSIAEGLITTGKEGEILYMNRAAENLTEWKMSEAKNLPLEKVYHVVNEESGEAFENVVSRILRKKQLVEFENNTLLFTKNWKQLIISNSGSPLFDSKGNITGTVLVFNDVTEKKIAAASKLKAIERYDILAKATSDTIWDWDIANDKMLYNPGITMMFGYQLLEVNNVLKWWETHIHPDDLGAATEAYFGAISSHTENIHLEYRFLCANGTYKYIYDRAFVIYDFRQNPIRMIGAMQDISNSKKEERKIAKATIDAQEKERQYIGQELHDNVNQLLASSLLTLGILKKHATDNSKLTQLADLIKSYTSEALNEIRKLSHELAPASFDDNTLKDAFEALLNGINLNNRFSISFDFDECINTAVSTDIQINLFRIFQEQIKNILKYSGATLIKVAATKKRDSIQLSTFDNGVGFKIKEVKKGIGLSNIKKRVDSFGGKLVINTAPGKGCEMIIEIAIAETLCT